MQRTPGRAVLFDFDDTLVRTRECKVRAIQALAERHYGVSMPSATIDASWGLPYDALFARLFGELDADLARVIQRYEALNEEFPVVAYDDAIATLEAAFAREMVLGVVTAAGEIIISQMAAVGFPVARFLLVQTARDTPHHKPDPRVFAPALAKLAAHGIGADAITYVGDALNDFRAASAAGLSFLGVHGRTTEASAFARAGARSVASLSALLDLL
jgi:phosphoglycolate phosphatase-like HAD superfamily hydrolase